MRPTGEQVSSPVPNWPVTAQILDIAIEEREGLFVATCPTVPELLIAHAEIATLMQAIPDVIKAIYLSERQMHVDVLLANAEDRSGFRRPWVVIPVADAREAVA